jgi:flagellar protein FliS
MSAAKASYSSIDLTSRLEGATPHQLIAILFDELVKALEAMTAALERGDPPLATKCQARALTILTGLQTSLDMENGGEIATNLASVYAEARRLALLAGRTGDATSARQAHDMIGEIAGAWASIG